MNTVPLASLNCPLSSDGELFIWLIPLAPVVGIAAAGLRVFPWSRALLNNAVTLECLKDLALHSAFYCYVLTSLLGLSRCGPEWVVGLGTLLLVALCLSTAWACAWQERRLSLKSH
jgi:hypothetical protein